MEIFKDFLSSIPKILKKAVLFLSSYIPLFIFLVINTINFEKNVINQLSKLKCMILFISIVSLLAIRFVCSSKTKSTIFFKRKYYESLEKTGDNIISYLMTYVVPLMTSIQSGKIDLNNLIINLFLFIIIGIVYIKQDLVYLNPLLSILSFNVYKSESNEHYVISRLSTHTMKLIEDKSDEYKNIELYLYRITDTTSYLKKKKIQDI